MGLILTNEQRMLTDEIYHWYMHSSEQVFQYTGGAGRGKSTVAMSALSRLNIPIERMAPMAYTGAASLVMRTKGLYNAKTIHSTLYSPVKEYQIDIHGNSVMNTYFNRPKTRNGFEPKPLNDVDLMFIDEGWTVPYNMKYEIESRNIKILVCGDPYQLPPVGDKPAYLKQGKIFRLTQPMRQKDGDGIFYISERARLGLPIHKGFYGNAIVIDEDELTDDMIRFSDIIICSKNSTREEYNKYVRENVLGINQDLPMRGERLICRNNNWMVELDGINLVNGLIGEVSNHPDVSGFDGKTFKIDFHPFLLNSSFKNIPVNYRYYSAPYDLKKEIKQDRYETGEFFEFAYAITSYLAQGGEFNRVIYVEEDFIPSIQTNTNYVGASRAKGFLIYVKRKKKFYY